MLRRIAERETATEKARDQYTYRQTVTIDELNANGLSEGNYREVRDITFAPDQSRFEKVMEGPVNGLTHLKLTQQDFDDIRRIQPFVLTKEQMHLYSLEFKGEEAAGNTPCFVVAVAPKQILSGQRYFQGLLWVRQSDFSVVKSEGQAVPQIETLKEQNLFPHFSTTRKEAEGGWLFPAETLANDTLYFRSGPQRIRVRIRYTDYKRFGADSTIHFSDEEKKDQ